MEHDHASRSPSPQASVAGGAAEPGRPRRLKSSELFEGRVELVIEHRGREYRLRVTQNGKLILTA
jgi:hemin uptake protein HemP